MTTIVTIALAFTAKFPIVQVTVLVPMQTPCVDEEETNVGPVGSVSVTVTAVAGDGPLLVTMIL